jgi:hypothetical protein
MSAEIRYIVQLSTQSPRWLLSGDGSSHRTCVMNHAKRWRTKAGATRALKITRRYRSWPDAVVVAVQVTVEPVAQEGGAQ